MKTENVVNFAIKAVIWALSCYGVFSIFGSIGRLECTDMTMIQFCFQELVAVACIIFAFKIYANKEVLSKQLLKNYN